ncbi:hypothetical protein F4810DRAFT_161261 [Camillea tinctor]|nr:hypothetical protein F4810DRAFT_161261 [Camillea tinctor]
MVSLTVTPQYSTQPNPAETTRVTSSGNHVKVDSGDQSVSIDQDDLFYGDFQTSSQAGGGKPIVFRPQVTVNIHNTPGSSGEGSSTAVPDTGRPGTNGSTIDNRSNAGSDNDLVSILVSQVAALSKKVDELSSLASARVQDGIRFETGMWNTADVRPWERHQEKTSGRINFPKEFKYPPRVMVSMTSADVSKEHNFRVAVYPTNIDQWGFTVNADSWSDTQLWSAGVSWMAVGE